MAATAQIDPLFEARLREVRTHLLAAGRGDAPPRWLRPAGDDPADERAMGRAFDREALAGDLVRQAEGGAADAALVLGQAQADWLAALDRGVAARYRPTGPAGEAEAYRRLGDPAGPVGAVLERARRLAAEAAGGGG